MPDPLGDLSYTWPFYAAALLGYLVGSVPFGLVLTKLAGLKDIRSIGSGSIGATNVLRTGKKGLALATLLLDGGKGAIPGVLAAVLLIVMLKTAMLQGGLNTVWQVGTVGLLLIVALFADRYSMNKGK